MDGSGSVGDCDVLVVGAGLAGLRCAALLAGRGYDVAVWEAAHHVGGRVATDVIDGFRCDRGFQVLNPAYPELRQAIDIGQLRLQMFGAGVLVRRDQDLVPWVHPVREPRAVPRMLMRGGLTPGEVWALLRWAAPAARPRALTRARGDTTLVAALDRGGVNGTTRRVLDRFLAGVLLDDTGSTSNAFALLLVRMFALGAPGLPAGGMSALPDLLARPIIDRIRLGRTVVRIVRAGLDWAVSDDGGTTVRAREVVVAVDGPAAEALTGAPAPPTKGVVTDWWATDTGAEAPALVCVDGRTEPPGPVVNAAVISAAAPTYAPAGRHLVAASALLGSGRRAPAESAMRRHAAEMLGFDPSTWTPVVRHEVPHALPAQPAPLSVRRPARDPNGLWLCGDHRDTASIQGALVSGRRVAEAIAARGRR